MRRFAVFLSQRLIKCWSYLATLICLIKLVWQCRMKFHLGQKQSLLFHVVWHVDHSNKNFAKQPLLFSFYTFVQALQHLVDCTGTFWPQVSKQRFGKMFGDMLVLLAHQLMIWSKMETYIFIYQFMNSLYKKSTNKFSYMSCEIFVQFDPSSTSNKPT